VSVFLHLIKWSLGLAPPEVWTTDGERDCLARHAAGKRNLVEIGVWHAGTARTLRAAMSADGTLYAVDPYEKGRLGFSIPRAVGTRELSRVRNGRVIWIRAMGWQAARSDAMRAASPFDLVFVDAAQTYDSLRDEWQAWAPLISNGGLIALHDSRPTDEGPEQGSVTYTREVVLHDRRFAVVETIDSLTVLRRVAA
jgi:predicted O-methyltransferase YrrM